jgi:hypothetical protein
MEAFQDPHKWLRRGGSGSGSSIPAKTVFLRRGVTGRPGSYAGSTGCFDTRDRAFFRRCLLSTALSDRKSLSTSTSEKLVLSENSAEL